MLYFIHRPATYMKQEITETGLWILQVEYTQKGTKYRATLFSLIEISSAYEFT
jgi:hypothetical protein